jgi:hypothetical protein
MFPAFFAIDQYATNYRVDLTITATTARGINSGSSTLLFYKNQLPTGGNCTVSPPSGTTTTNFTISCLGWSDPDGNIVRYEYYGWF